MLCILHLSDLQCGKPFRPDAAAALVRFARAVGPDVVVVAGDLTQRAKPREFVRAARLLEELGDGPVVVTPGNHDVPLYRVWERLFAPYRNWRRHVSPLLNEVRRVEGATFVALSSAAPHRAIVGGRLDAAQVDFARSAFSEAPDTDVRVLVVHHHFVPTVAGEGGRPLPRARALLEAFEDMGVDLVLGGHIHQTRVLFSRELVSERAGPGIPLIACGTTTSGRGRGGERGWNSLNQVCVGPTSMEITAYRRPPGGTDFERAESVSVERLRPARDASAQGAGGAAADAIAPVRRQPHGAGEAHEDREGPEGRDVGELREAQARRDAHARRGAP
jgi:3',5'-cyclic AMP phosphodiesterase CpdA